MVASAWDMMTPMLADLTAFAVCGWSGSGKTTLIEAIIPRLRKAGLRVVVLKHSLHGFELDRPGKDSDRFFQAGADVSMGTAAESFCRRHKSDDEDLSETLSGLVDRYDLVLVEGHKQTPLPKVWLLSPGEKDPPTEVSGIVSVLAREIDRERELEQVLWDWLKAHWAKTKVTGCVLIGGRSARMGTPKHLIRDSGRTWLARTLALMRRVTADVVVAGQGEIPADAGRVTQLPDVREAQGPIAGILAALRWCPRSSFLVTACDLPELSLESLQWLLSNRRPGVWATLPRLSGSEHPEPLLAHYDFRARFLLESLVRQGDFSPSGIARFDCVESPAPPSGIQRAWRNVNRPEDL